MKKFNPSNLFFFAGILWLFAGITSEDMSWGYALGFAFIALSIAMRIKDSFIEDSEEGELLTDEEEKKTWEEFQGKAEENEENIS